MRDIPLRDIAPNPHQPRRDFPVEALQRLADSIRHEGLVQPIVVRPAPDASPSPAGQGAREKPWQLVAGERRLRAAQLARLDSIAVIVVEMPDRQAAEWALVENVQREDLNPLERAWAVRQLRDDFAIRQQDIADRLGLSRPSVANLLRLTELEQPIQDLISTGALSLGHGKALLAAPAGAGRERLARKAAERRWTVRQVEREAKAAARAAAPTAESKQAPAVPLQADALRRAARVDLERRLAEKLGAPVTIHVDASGKKGALRITFYDLDHFDALLQNLGVTQAT